MTQAAVLLLSLFKEAEERRPRDASTPNLDRASEVVADAATDRRQRRRFRKEDKLRSVREADGCNRGEVAALLPREGV